MRTSNTIYLAYGSNLNLEQMAYRCPTARVLGAAYLEGYRLEFNGNDGNAVATVTPSEGSRVPVLLWEINEADEAALDRYEGWPHLYRKETVTVEFEAQPTEAMVYIMNEGRGLGRPSRYYYFAIHDGYTSAGFDTTKLDEAVEFSTPKGRRG